MKSFAVIAAAAGIASAASSGWGATHYVTDVVTAYTTYCPEATMITHGDVTYTVTSATTLTISNCPCTITRPVSSWVSASSSCTKSASAASVAPAATKSAVSSGAAVPVAPVSSTYFAPVPKASSSATTSAVATSYTGAASKVQVAGGLLAALGLAAAAL